MLHTDGAFSTEDKFIANDAAKTITEALKQKQYGTKEHPVPEPYKCKKGYIRKVAGEVRATINVQLWKLSYNDRKKWLFSEIKQIRKKTMHGRS